MTQPALYLNVSDYRVSVLPQFEKSCYTSVSHAALIACKLVFGTEANICSRMLS